MKRIKTTALILTGTLLLSLMVGCGSKPQPSTPASSANKSANSTLKVNKTVAGLKIERSMELKYATQFTVDYAEGGYKIISLPDGTQYVGVPEGAKMPEITDKKVKAIKLPIKNIFLGSTPAMSMFHALNAIDAVSLTTMDRNGWYYEEPKQAMDAGKLKFAGKYNKPDYELILATKSEFAAVSLMMRSTPAIREKLESTGVTVLMDHSSLEKHPLGRTEWVRLYGALLNKEKDADDFMAKQEAITAKFANTPKTDKTVAFFYVPSGGTINVRKSNDYLVKMIEIAGGNYVFKDLDDSDAGSSTIAMEMEKFYEQAKDVDYIIYNSAVGGDLKDLDELFKRNVMFKEFKAVKNKNVWVMSKNMYQELNRFGEMIKEINELISLKPEALPKFKYLRQLK